MSDRSPDVRPSTRGYEERDLSNRMLMVGLVVLAALTVVSVGLMAGLLEWFEARDAVRRAPRSPLIETDVQAPAPTLETEPGQILARLRRLEETQLTTWAWLDAEAGLARIPIDRAIEIVAERGLAHRPEAPEQEAVR